MASAVLAEGQVAFDEWGFDCGEGCGAEAFFAEKGVDRAGGGGGHEHALGVSPAVAFGGSTADEDGAGGAEGDELVGVDREVFPLQGAGVLEEVAGHPVVLVGGGYVFDDLAPVAAVELCAALAGGADVGDGETLVVGHGDESGFAVAGVALDSKLQRPMMPSVRPAPLSA